MKNNKILSIIKYVLLVLGALTVVPMFVLDINSVDFMLYCAYGFFAIAVILMVVMTIANFGKDAGKSKIGLWVAIGVTVLAVLSYFVFASTSPVSLADGQVISDELTLRSTDALLYVSYGTFAALVLAVIGGEISNSIK